MENPTTRGPLENAARRQAGARSARTDDNASGFRAQRHAQAPRKSISTIHLNAACRTKPPAIAAGKNNLTVAPEHSERHYCWAQ
jgi:hypothetical protein